jgi:hypothetical protein
VPILPCTDDQYDPVYDRLDAMEPVQEEPSEEPDNECQNCGAPGGYPWCSETCERVGQPPEELIPEPEPDVTDGITPESAERAAQQLVDMALSLLLESRQGREYLDMHYWLQGRLNEAWRGR